MKRFGILFLISWVFALCGFTEMALANVVIKSMSPAAGWAGTTTSNGTLLKIKGTGFFASLGGNEVFFTDIANAQTVKAKVEWALADGNAYAFSQHIGKPGTGGGGLNRPWDIAINESSGNIYVVNQSNKRIEVFNSNGQFVRMIGQSNLTSPWGVAVDTKGNIYVSDQVNQGSGQITVFDKNGSVVKQIGAGVLKSPRDLVADKSGAVYVIENHNRFVKFASNGQKVFSLEGPLHRKFDYLAGIALDPFGYPCSGIYLTDRNNNNVYWYNHYGLFLGRCNIRDFPLPSYAVPEGITVDNQGTFIVQVGDGVYAKLSKALKWIGEIEIKGQVGNAHMRAIDTKKRLYTVDYIQHTVKVFSPTNTGELWVRVPPGARTGPIQVKNKGGSETSGIFTVYTVSGSISVADAKPIQGLSTYPFVIGKETLVYARINGLFGHPGRDKATVEILGPGLNNTKPAAFDHLEYDPGTKITTAYFHVPAGRIKQAGDFTFRVVITRDGKIYHKKDYLKTFSGTKPNGLIFMRLSNVPNGQWNTKDPFPWFDMRDFLKMIANYQRTYPIHAGELIYRFSGDQYAPELADGEADKKNRSDLLLKAQLTLNTFNDPFFPGIRKVVGLMDYKVKREPGLGGVAPPNSDLALVFGLSPSRLVHELGHSFGLIPNNWPNHNASNKSHSINYNFSGEAGAPLMVWNSTDDKLYPGSSSSMVATIMNPGGGSGRGFFECQYKNTKVDYWYLFNRFKNTSNPVTYTLVSSKMENLQTKIQNFTMVGTIDKDGRVFIAHSYLYTTDEMPESPSAGDYRLVFQNTRGNVLQSYAFSPSFDQGDGGVSTSGVFSLDIPFPPSTVNVEIRLKKKVLKEFGPSLNPPLVESVSVEVEQSRRPVIRWTAKDRDEDPLKYDLYYAPTSESEFLPIICGLLETSYIWDTELIGGSSGAIIKVVASDGFNTGIGISSAFELSEKPPSAAIIHPDSPTTVLEGSRVFVRGLAYDPEDGILNGAQLTWYIDGLLELGTGYYLDAGIAPRAVSTGIQRMPLKPGDHIIRLTAKDSDGNIASDSVTIHVDADSDRDGLADALEIVCGSDPANPLSVCPKISYAVKFVCGKGQDRLVVQGRYLTAINVRNTENVPVTCRWRMSSACKPSPHNTVTTDMPMNPNETMEIGCHQISSRCESDSGIHTGYLVIESPVPLNVVAVYTVSGEDGQVESIHTERVMPEKPRTCPDLLIENIERPIWQQQEHRTNIQTRVVNVGTQASPPVMARLVDHAYNEMDGRSHEAIATIPYLAPGASHIVTFYLPYWVYDRNVLFDITVDDAGEVSECDENNNMRVFRDEG